MDEQRVREIVAEETRPLSPIGCAVLIVVALTMFLFYVSIQTDRSLEQRIQQLEVRQK